MNNTPSTVGPLLPGHVLRSVLLEKVGAQWRAYALLAVCLVAELGASLVTPWYLARGLDGQRARLVTVLVFAATYGSLVSCRVFGERLLALRIGAALRAHCHGMVLRLPFSEHLRRRTASVIAASADAILKLEEVVGAAPAVLIRGPLLFVGSLTMMAALSAPLTAAALLGGGCVGLTAVASGRIVSRLAGKAEESRAAVIATMDETARAIETVYASGGETEERGRLAAAERTHAALEGRSIVASACASGALTAEALAMLGILFGFGCHLVDAGRLSRGALVALFGYAIYLQSALAAVASFVTRAQAAVGVACQALAPLMNQAAPLEHQTPVDGDSHRQGHGLTVTRLHYEVEGQTLLRNVSFEVTPGELCVITGPSGGGKSTLLRVLAGLLAPTSGTIAVPCRTPREGNVRPAVAYVPQTPWIHRASALDNLRYGAGRATEDDVRAAAETACCHDFVAAMPDGYATVLGSGGRALSGGQAQRLALARAMVRKPAILLVDEPTSALDEASAAHVRRAVAQRRALVTVVVSHDPQLAQEADVVVVLQGGRVTEVRRKQGALPASSAFARETHSEMEPLPS